MNYSMYNSIALQVIGIEMICQLHWSHTVTQSPKIL